MEEQTKISQDFFKMFCKVRNEIADVNGYFLETAIRKTFDEFQKEMRNELDQLLMETGQVFHGFINEEYWSEYDESVKNRIIEFRKKFTYDVPLDIIQRKPNLKDDIQARIDELSNQELIDKCRKQLSELCRTGGKSFNMTIPPMIDDTDVLFDELANRLEKSHELAIKEMEKKIILSAHSLSKTIRTGDYRIGLRTAIDILRQLETASKNDGSPA